MADVRVLVSSLLYAWQVDSAYARQVYGRYYQQQPQAR